MPLTTPQKALVESIWPLILSEAAYRKARAPWHVSTDDLVQVGAAVACRVAMRFDFSRNLKFTTLAVRRIRWELFDYCQPEWDRTRMEETLGGQCIGAARPIEPIEWKLSSEDWRLLNDVLAVGVTGAGKRRGLSKARTSRLFTAVKAKLQAQGVLG
jgi:hypothetical protein